MADPFSLASSAVGVISLAIQACQGIIQYYNSVKSSNNDISKMITSTEALVKMLKLLRTILEEGDSDSDVKEMVEESIKNCASAVGELDIELVKVRKVKPTTLTEKIHEKGLRLLYPFRESTLLKLQQIVTDMRENLMLAIDILQVYTTSLTFQELKEMATHLDHVEAGIASIGHSVDYIKAQHIEQENQAILDWLSPLNFWSTQIDTFSRRQEGTIHWLELVKLYLRELLRCVNELTESITNEPSSTVIETLKIGSLATSLGLAYVYCNHKDQGSQTVSELIASLVQQLSRQRRRVPEDARVLYTMHHSSRTRPVLMEWLQVFRSIITDFSNVYIVIDALDECNEADGTRRTLIEELRRLPGLHILCTSRYLGDIARLLQDATQLELRASDADIARFLDCQITEEKDLMRFCERDPSLRNDMIEKIVKQADGMFLLAQLHMQSLARKITLKRVRESLKHLPEKLDGLYEEAMDRIRGQDRDRFELAHRLLCWITYAFEPLNMDAVQHAILAMDLDSDLSSVDNENVVPSDLLITVCAGLVVIDTESNIIRLVHHTTQEYFDRRRQTLFPAAQIDISRACVKYLLQPIFENGPCSTKEEIATRKIECPFFIYTARHWGNHARGTPESELAPLILKLLTNELSLASLVQGMTDGTYSGRNLDQTYIMKTPAISVVASFGLVTIVNLLLSDGIDITGTGSDESTPLHHAVWGGHLDLVKLLLQNKADIKTVATVDNVKQTALQGAASKGYAGIVRLLVEHGAEIEFTDENGRSALHHAAQNGHEEATRELLRSGADVAVIDRVGETPLRKASKRNNAGVVEVLTGHWKDTLTATRQSCMLLQYAAKSGDDTLFETFMLKLTGDTRLLKDG